MLRTIWIKFLQFAGFDPRGLFFFWDGRWYRRVDPMVVARRLWSCQVPVEIAPGKWEAMPFESLDALKLVKSGVGTEIQKGYAQIEQAVRESFELRPFEQGGLSEDECQKLLARFEDWMGDVKKNGSNLPTSSTSTDSTDPSPTNNASDSGSTSTDNSSVMPDVSHLESRLQTTL